jgi:ribosomal protein S18 acetylase RimI-like enzyme
MAMLTTREAQIGDLTALVHLLWDDPQGRKRESLDETAKARYRSAFKAIKDDQNSAVIVSVDGRLICGFLQVSMLPGLSYQGIWRALIEDVRVAKSHRRAGVGRSLVQAAIDFAAVRRCELVELFVHQDREAAHKFYEACGFECVHRGFRKVIEAG